MPGDGLSLAVGIGCKPHGRCLLGCLLQIRDHLLLVRGDYIFRSEILFDVDAQFFFLKVPDVSETGLHHVVVAEELLYSLGFCRRLDDN